MDKRIKLVNSSHTKSSARENRQVNDENNTKTKRRAYAPCDQQKKRARTINTFRLKRFFISDNSNYKVYFFLALFICSISVSILGSLPIYIEEIEIDCVAQFVAICFVLTLISRILIRRECAMQSARCIWILNVELSQAYYFIKEKNEQQKKWDILREWEGEKDKSKKPRRHTNWEYVIQHFRVANFAGISMKIAHCKSAHI